MSAEVAQKPLVSRPAFSSMTDKALARYLANNAVYVSGDDSQASRAAKETTANMAFDRKLDDFAAALDDAALLDAEVTRTSVALNLEIDRVGQELGIAPRGAMGLVPDAVKFTPSVVTAGRAYDQAFQALRTFNGPFVKRFAKELHEHRTAMRQATMLKNSQQSS